MPDLGVDADHLRHHQYRNSSNLAKRSDLHVKYRTAPEGVFDWLAHLLPLREATTILDVGCGPGWLWQTLAPKLSSGVELTLADLSHGMVAETVDRNSALGATAIECDAQALPLMGSSFDLVVSTYSLYHVPDPRRAVKEARQVVAREGVLAVVTNGPGHLREIEDLRAKVLGADACHNLNKAFPPARAASEVVELFDDVTWTRYDDELHCLEADDVVAFALSYTPGERATTEQVAMMHEIVTQRMADHDGVFVVSKDTGAVIGRRRRCGVARP